MLGSDDQRLLLESVRRFSREQLLAADRRWDLDESSMYELLPAAADVGLLGLMLPEDLGGLGCDLRTYAQIIRELAYASASMAVTVAVHSMVTKILCRDARDPWRSEWLGRLAGADHLTAFAISEADAGSDPSSSRTSAKQAPGGYRVTGSKMWVTNGTQARWFVVLVRTDADQPGATGLSALLLDGNSPGLERDKIRGKMGIRGSETSLLVLNDVFVPRDRLLGEEGWGMEVCLGALDEGRIGIASQALGISQACLDLMVAYAPQRVQFGQPISQFQAVRNMIADSAVDIEVSRQLIDQAAWYVDRGRKKPRACAEAKLYASEAANRIAYRAVQVHGGSGYVRDSRVEQLFRDARITTIYEGTSEIQRHVIAKELIRSGVDPD